MNQNDFIERETLLQVKRNWSEHEIIKQLMEQNKTLEFRIGELKSEIEEVRFQNNELIKELNEYKKTNKHKKQKAEYRKEDYIKELLNRISYLRDKKNEYKKMVTEWRNKYYGASKTL
jgi:chromosome segregation ATPase